MEQVTEHLNANWMKKEMGHGSQSIVVTYLFLALILLSVSGVTPMKEAMC